MPTYRPVYLFKVVLYKVHDPSVSTVSICDDLLSEEPSPESLADPPGESAMTRADWEGLSKPRATGAMNVAMDLTMQGPVTYLEGNTNLIPTGMVTYNGGDPRCTCTCFHPMEVCYKLCAPVTFLFSSDQFIDLVIHIYI